MSSAGGPKDLRRTFEKELLGQLWEGKVNAAIELLKGALEWVRNPAGSRTDRVPGESASVYPQLPATATGGVMDRQHTGGEIQRQGGVGTLQTPGDELVATRGAGPGHAGSRGATVNSTLGVGTVRSQRGYRNRFAKLLDHETRAPTGEREAFFSVPLVPFERANRSAGKENGMNSFLLSGPGPRVLGKSQNWLMVSSPKYLCVCLPAFLPARRRPTVDHSHVVGGDGCHCGRDHPPSGRKATRPLASAR